MNPTQWPGLIVKGFSRRAIAVWMLLAIAGCTSPVPSEETSPSPESDTTADPAPEGALPTDDVILQTVYDQIEPLDLCDGFFQPEVTQADSQVYRVDNRALVELVCAQAAYQSVYAYGVYQADGSWQPLALEVFYPDQTGQFVRTQEATVGGLASFDPETGRLTMFSKARGLGDCGSLAEYRWSGSELVLETFRYQECSDSPQTVVDPVDYPQIYP